MILLFERCLSIANSCFRSRRLAFVGVVVSVSLLFNEASACERCQKWGPFYKDARAAMARMDAATKAADEGLTGTVDADFIRLMIPHHQGAVDMAKAVLLHGTDPALRNIAQEIVAEQTIEIQYLQKLQDRLAAVPAPATSAPHTTPVTVRSPVAAAGSDFRLVANESPAAPAAPPKVTDYAYDRVYTCDQVSNTVSVIDPSQNKLLGIIKLGELPPAMLSALYKGQNLVHGAGFSPDGSRLCVVSIGSNSLTLIDTATNAVIRRTYLGRSPHEAFFTPDGKEIYVTVRGEDYVSVLDAQTLAELARIHTNVGPGMTLFRPDGKYAFVPSSFTPELCVIDTKTREVIARVPQASPFSPNLGVSADGRQVWFTLKDSGKTQILSAEPPFAILGTLDSGPITNHVTCVDNANGHFAYVTVGGLDQVKVYRRDPPFEQVAAIDTGALPHGIWGPPDGSRVYIGLEHEAKVQAIDTLTNKVIATIPIGQLPQALVYVPGAAVHQNGQTAANLVALETLKESKTYQLRSKDATQSARASVTVISLGLIDQVQIAADGLVPGQEYTLSLVDSADTPRVREPLAKIKANPFGSVIADTLGPVRGTPLADGAEKAGRTEVTFILEPENAATAAVLIQR